jgi:hypothetical protein
MVSQLILFLLFLNFFFQSAILVVEASIGRVFGEKMKWTAKKVPQRAEPMQLRVMRR